MEKIIIVVIAIVTGFFTSTANAGKRINYKVKNLIPGETCRDTKGCEKRTKNVVLEIIRNHGTNICLVCDAGTDGSWKDRRASKRNSGNGGLGTSRCGQIHPLIKKWGISCIKPGIVYNYKQIGGKYRYFELKVVKKTSGNTGGVNRCSGADLRNASSIRHYGTGKKVPSAAYPGKLFSRKDRPANFRIGELKPIIVKCTIPGKGRMNDKDEVIQGPEKVKVCKAYLYNPGKVSSTKSNKPSKGKVDGGKGEKGDPASDHGNKTSVVKPPVNNGDSWIAKGWGVEGLLTFSALCGMQSPAETWDFLDGSLMLSKQLNFGKPWSFHLMAGVATTTRYYEAYNGETLEGRHNFKFKSGMEFRYRVHKKVSFVAGGGVLTNFSLYGSYVEGGVNIHLDDDLAIVIKGGINPTTSGAIPYAGIGLSFTF